MPPRLLRLSKLKLLGSSWPMASETHSFEVESQAHPANGRPAAGALFTLALLLVAFLGGGLVFGAAPFQDALVACGPLGLSVALVVVAGIPSKMRPLCGDKALSFSSSAAPARHRSWIAWDRVASPPSAWPSSILGMTSWPAPARARAFCPWPMA